eukprot:gnl/MRDRNA2_/MRDRNA2_100616_c0_seq1.p1 gnl/MRDRNA2_/MRDRNA2_100616_c0~~gnl/MRDRNA2_/MRDRNA2_100616_c0_seq1.p1  ORF type:complete len:301 (+),score=74.35 gnl/MRDRNA2_/MRDRNA2_100616_c0_seq1:142-1044(+)
MVSLVQFNAISGVTDLDKKGSMKAPQNDLMVPSILQPEQGTKAPDGASNAQLVPALLLELVTIITQISQLDAMFDKVKGSAPSAGSEADKWHQVSVQALQTSRKYMVEQQTSLFQRLANATGTSLPVLAKSDGAATLENKKDVIPEQKQKEVSPPPGLDPSVPDLNAGLEGSTDGNSLRNYLEKIKMHTPGCALLIRKIKPLGFESPEHLRAHCEQFGKVAEVLVSHCITKPSPKRAKGRIRPAALGFVVMASPEDADAVFAHGQHQNIAFRDGSVTVEVQRFREITEDIEDAGVEESLL